jgi:hypothetical protein
MLTLKHPDETKFKMGTDSFIANCHFLDPVDDPGTAARTDTASTSSHGE